MPRNGWLTPDEIPETFVCRTLTIPANWAGIVSCVSGAIYPLTLPENWEEFGVVTPHEIAAAMQVMYLAWLNQSGECAVTDGVPVGAMVEWLGADDAIPAKWIKASGNPVLIADYPDLYDVIGHTYATYTPDTGYFQLPDMRGRSPMGSGGSIGVRGEYHGAATHVLSTSEIPAHNHTQRGNVAGSGSLSNVISQSGNPSGLTAATTTTSVGGGLAHNNLHPVLLMHYIIKVLP